MILMNRRHFLKMATLSAGVTLASGPPATAAKTRLRRRYCRTSFGDIAYLDRGKGPAALFHHGWPLNGYHWRDSLTLLSGMRHCIAPDLMGLGHSQVPNQADLSPRSQATMLLAFMDALGIYKPAPPRFQSTPPPPLHSFSPFFILNAPALCPSRTAMCTPTARPRHCWRRSS